MHPCNIFVRVWILGWRLGYFSTTAGVVSLAVGTTSALDDLPQLGHL